MPATVTLIVRAANQRALCVSIQTMTRQRTVVAEKSLFTRHLYAHIDTVKSVVFLAGAARLILSCWQYISTAATWIKIIMEKCVSIIINN